MRKTGRKTKFFDVKPPEIRWKYRVFGRSEGGCLIAQIAEFFVKHCGQVAGETLAFYTMAHGQEASFLNDWARELRHGV